MLFKMSMLAALIVSASAVPVPAAIPNVSPLVQGAAASTTINHAAKRSPVSPSDKRKDRKLQSPANSAYVQKDDIPLDMSDAITGLCEVNFCTGKELEWHMLGDPVEGILPAPTWVVAYPDRMTWSGLDNPKVTETESQVSCDNSGNSGEIKMIATIEAEEGTSMTTSTETESKVGVEFSVKAKIPEVAEVKGTTSFEVSTTNTTEKEVSQTVKTELSAEVKVGPREQKCVYVKHTTTTFESTWALPMQVTDRGGNGIRCQYGSTCNDHYFWFTHIDNGINGWYEMSGKSTAKVVTHGEISVRDGPCTSPNAGNGTIVI